MSLLYDALSGCVGNVAAVASGRRETDARALATEGSQEGQWRRFHTCEDSGMGGRTMR